MGKLDDKRVAILATDGVEQIELTAPREALEEEGAKVQIVSLEEGEIQGYEHLEEGETFTADKAVADVDPAEYDALLLPGGVANPDRLRTDENAVAFVRAFFDKGKPVAAICHAPWTLIEADVVRGRKLTSWPSLQTDLRNAGAEWTDEEVVVDEGLVTSRKPEDLPAFCEKIVEEFCEGEHELQKPKERFKREKEEAEAKS